jgi:tetratricopeptide (TPR) repeat protein
MTEMSDNLLTKEDASKTPAYLPTRDSVIQRVVMLGSDEASSVIGDQEHQLLRLIQTLRNRKGRFALIFVVCNEVPLRKALTQRLRDNLPDQRMIELHLNGEDVGLLDKFLNVPDAPDPLLVYGIENLLPSSDELKLRREDTLQELQLRREQFRKLGRPLVLWMPEYAYTMIGQQAVDFWSWQSGAFFFTEIQGRKAGIIVGGDRNVVVDKIPHSYQVVTPTVFPLHQLPSPPNDFIGREEELRVLLAQAGRGVKAVSLAGAGGIGKTALALKLAEHLKPRYPDAQFFLDLKGAGDNPTSPADAMAHVVRAYHPLARLPEAEDEMRAIYISVLDGQRALLLMDNAKDDKQIAPLLPPASCALIVTSRTHFTLPGLYAKDINRMTADDARDLLLRIAPRIGEQADEIARLCGCLPLALRVAASALKVRKNLTPSEYAERLRDAKQRLSHLREVDVVLSESYDMIGEENQKLWRALAVFPKTFDDAGASAVWGIGIDEAKDRLGDLLVYSLVEFDEETRHYSLHDLARLYADGRLSEEERNELNRRHAMHYERVLAECGELYLEGNESVARGLALFDAERENIEAGRAWAESLAERDEVASQLCIEYPNAGVYVLHLRQHPREQIRWLDSQLAAARRLKKRDYEGNALGNLGLAYAALGETRKAIEFYERRIEIAREIGDRRGEGNALGNLGLAYFLLGETRKAIEFYEQALVIDREIGDRRGEGNALGNLGVAYAALGETRKAIEFYEQQLIIVREIGDRRGEGNALGNLGNAYAALGETRKAIEFYEQALTVLRELGDKRGEGNALGNLGLAYAALGETRKAIEYHEQALTVLRELGDKRGEGNALGNLGNAYAALGETRKAIEFYEQALVIDREIGDRRGEGNALGNLGVAYADLGETRKAIEFYEQQLIIVREIGDRRGEGNALRNMSLSLDELGQRERAIEYAQAALKIREEIEDPRAEKVRTQLEVWRQADE